MRGAGRRRGRARRRGTNAGGSVSHPPGPSSALSSPSRHCSSAARPFIRKARLTPGTHLKMTSINPAFIGKVLDYQAKQICYNVYTFYKKRKRDPSTIEYQTDANLINIVSEVTGLSRSSISRIMRQGNKLFDETGVAIFKPQEKKKHIRKKRIEVNKHTEGIIRRKVIQFYTVKKEVPSIRKLNHLLKKENVLCCSNEYLRQMLHKLGFTNSTSGESKGMIMERSDIATERTEYLKSILEYRAQNRSIFFLNETKLWDDETAKDPDLQYMPSIIIVHANVGAGFIDGSLLMSKLRSKKAKKNDLDFEKFENYDWIKDHVTRNLPPSSIIVVNSPFVDDNKSKEDIPIASSSRAKMEEWLDRHQVIYRVTNSKAELLQLIIDEMKGKEYCVEKALIENGQTLLHLPTNHPDLNPVHVAWEGMKSELEDKTPNYLFRHYSREDWDSCFKLVVETETEYYENDTRLDEAVTDLASVKRELDSEEEKELILDLSFESD